MRSFSLTILAALVCAVAVSAAPKPSVMLTNPTIRDLIHVVSSMYSCVPDAVSQTIKGSDFYREIEELKDKYDMAILLLPMCPALADLHERYECITDKIDTFDRSFTDLINKVSMKDKALAEKIQTDPKVNCIKVKPYYREAFQCMVKSGEEASTKNGLAERWEGFQPQFEKRLDAWKQCQVPFCDMKEMGYGYSLFYKYLDTIAYSVNFDQFLYDLNQIMGKCL